MQNKAISRAEHQSNNIISKAYQLIELWLIVAIDLLLGCPTSSSQLYHLQKMQAGNFIQAVIPACITQMNENTIQLIWNTNM